MLSENHHNLVLEPLANDHVTNSGRYELLIKLFLVPLGGKESFEIVNLVGQPDPTVSVQNVGYVFQLVGEGDLVDPVQLVLHGLVVERVSL